MTVQTSYNKNTDRAILGLIHDVNPHDIASYAAEVAIGFGIVVGLGTNKERQCVVGAGAGVLGIAIRTAKEGTYHDSDFNAQYEIADTVGVMRMGAMWVRVKEGEAPVAGTAATYDVDGQFLTSAGTVLAGAKFVTGPITNTNISGVTLALVRIVA